MLQRRCSVCQTTPSSPSTGMWRRWHRAGLIELGKVLNAPLEVNIFHTEDGREEKIRESLLKHGAPDVLMPTTEAQLSYIDSNRKFVHPEGILKRMPSSCRLRTVTDVKHSEKWAKRGGRDC